MRESRARANAEADGDQWWADRYLPLAYLPIQRLLMQQRWLSSFRRTSPPAIAGHTAITCSGSEG